MQEIRCTCENINIDSVKEMRKQLRAQHFFDIMCNELENQKNDNIVIWGTYYNAFRMRTYLQNVKGIKNIKACVVNEKYINSEVNQMKEREEFPLISVEKWFEQNNKTTIIIDFSFFNDEMVQGFKEKIDKIYIGDVMGVIILDEPYVISKEDYFENEGNLEETYSFFKHDEMSGTEFLQFILQKNIGFYSKSYHKSPQYFDKDVIRLSDKEVLIDCGGYIGDTVNEFVKATSGCYDKIYSFEMDKSNYERLVDNCQMYKDCVCVNKGVGQESKEIRAKLGNGAASHLSDEGSLSVKVVALDEELGLEEKITFIKMDVEGAELDALRGAEGIIKKYHPKLAICLYHKFSDLYLIPQYIKQIVPQYKLYFRNYHNSASECVLYAIM